jgi:hypothetical protein
LEDCEGRMKDTGRTSKKYKAKENSDVRTDGARWTSTEVSLKGHLKIIFWTIHCGCRSISVGQTSENNKKVNLNGM